MNRNRNFRGGGAGGATAAADEIWEVVERKFRGPPRGRGGNYRSYNNYQSHYYKGKAAEKMQHIGTKNIKASIREILLNYKDILTLTGEIKTRLQPQCCNCASSGAACVCAAPNSPGPLSPMSTASAAKFIETLMSWNIHEPFTLDPWLRKQLQRIRESDGYPILHWVFWPRGSTHPAEMKEFKNFARTEDDMIHTEALCLSLGSTPLELNAKKETAIDSLRNSFLRGNMSKITYERAHDLLTYPPDEVKLRVARSVINKIANVDQLEYVPILAWLVVVASTILSRVLTENLIALRKKVRDSDGFYTIVHNRITLMRILLSKGPLVKNHHTFDYFFNRLEEKSSNKKITGEQLSNKFTTELMRNCREFNYEFLTEDQKEQNVDIIGAIIGELVPFGDCGKISEDFVAVRFVTHPSVAMTCLIHIKKNHPKFKCAAEIIKSMEEQHQRTKDSMTRFQILSLLEMLHGKKLFAADIGKLHLEEKKGAPPDDDLDSDDIKSLISNPYDKKVSFRSLGKIKDTEAVSFNGKTWSIPPIDDMFYGLDTLFRESILAKNTDTLLEMIILRAAETINTKHQMEILLLYLTPKDLRTTIRAITKAKSAAIIELVHCDNPFASKVLEQFAL